MSNTETELLYRKSSEQDADQICELLVDAFMRSASRNKSLLLQRVLSEEDFYDTFKKEKTSILSPYTSENHTQSKSTRRFEGRDTHSL